MDVLNLPKIVWLSEDASGIVSNIEFDPQTNQMVGIVLPFDQSNGMPIPFTYLARNAAEIELNMQRTKSVSVYVIMAQPIMEGIPPFVLQLFGTDNRFKTQHVLLRWQHTLDELKR